MEERKEATRQGERGEGGVNRKVNGVGGRLFPLVIKSLSKSRGSYRFGSSRLTVASSPHLIRSYPHVSSPHRSCHSATLRSFTLLR